MKPEIKIEPAKFNPLCYGCLSAVDVRAVIIGHRSDQGGAANVSNICTECRALLLLALLAELPAVPCGHTMHAEIIGDPPFNVNRYVATMFGTLDLEEAAGLGAELIRKALEAAKL